MTLGLQCTLKRFFEVVTTNQNIPTSQNPQLRPLLNLPVCSGPVGKVAKGPNRPGPGDANVEGVNFLHF